MLGINRSLFAWALNLTSLVNGVIDAATYLMDTAVFELQALADKTRRAIERLGAVRITNNDFASMCIDNSLEPVDEEQVDEKHVEEKAPENEKKIGRGRG